MRVQEFIGGPCGWGRFAPANLRNSVPGWKVYSTSRFLGGADAEILDVLDTGVSSVAPGLDIELLPPTLADRWRSIGLRFATRAEIEKSGFRKTLTKSLDLIRVVDSLQGTVSSLCRSLHPLLAPDTKTDVSYSDPDLPFSIFVSCPPDTERNAVERLAESLVHEALHLQLSLVEYVEPLITDASEGKQVFSPWAGEGRTVRGLLHAVYVFGNIRFFWKHIGSNIPDSVSFARTRIATINEEMSKAVHLARNDWLTATGQRLANSFLTA